MGEIAEAMLDGVFCQSCGELIGDGEGCGFPVTCEACGGDSEPEDDVLYVALERPLRVYGCEKCTRRFASKGALRNHYQDAHKTNPPHYCEECRRTFASPSAIKQHLRDKHGVAG